MVKNIAKKCFQFKTFVNFKLHIIKWCCFRTVKEDGVRPKRSREENLGVSVSHTLFCLFTMLDSWWPAPVGILIDIYLLCIFLFEYWRSKSSTNWGQDIHIWAYGGLMCAE